MPKLLLHLMAGLGFPRMCQPQRSWRKPIIFYFFLAPSAPPQASPLDPPEISHTVVELSKSYGTAWSFDLSNLNFDATIQFLQTILFVFVDFTVSRRCLPRGTPPASTPRRCSRPPRREVTPRRQERPGRSRGRRGAMRRSGRWQAWP